MTASFETEPAADGGPRDPVLDVADPLHSFVRVASATLPPGIEELRRETGRTLARAGFPLRYARVLGLSPRWYRERRGEPASARMPYIPRERGREKNYSAAASKPLVARVMMCQWDRILGGRFPSWRWTRFWEGGGRPGTAGASCHLPLGILGISDGDGAWVPSFGEWVSCWSRFLCLDVQRPVCPGAVQGSLLSNNT